ncbi:MAG: phenylacetate--CoA ligase, partial [Verrucomicrobia bacterium]
MSKFVVENRIWDKEESLTSSELATLQGTKLKETVERVQNVPFYKEAFAKTGITPGKIQSLDDLQRLPFTTKADLREEYPLRMLAVDRSEVARYHGSSGTTGKPTMVAYT